jgi:PAS domain S-box-containing protein
MLLPAPSGREVGQMDSTESPPGVNAGDIEVFRALVEGTAATTGHEFFRNLTEGLSAAIGTHGAWVAVFRRETRELQAIAMKMGDEWWDGMIYPVDGTACETAIDSGKLVHIPERIIEFYPHSAILKQVHAVSYLGAPLFDVDGTTIGHFAVLHDEPLRDPRSVSIFRIFAARASAEMRRMKAEEALRERETHLQSVLDGAMDAILSLDGNLGVLLLNTSAERAFGAMGDMLGKSALDSFEPGSAERLRAVARRLSASKEGGNAGAWQWIAGGLEVRPRKGPAFFAEATLSHYVGKGENRFTLILRDINDRVEAEAKIRTLEQRAEALREEISRIQGNEAIIGESPLLLRALEDVAKVAPMDTTVLLSGDTGTGKELFARAVHDASPRKARPLITVNCAAIPGELIESELFGHEKGAFTGATSKREGRFALAHLGTIFLDEIGELPLPLQAKLLRVLQEGEFQTVGGSRTQKVDVRAVAATNRDLKAMVERGEFREDLYYRLNVFPIRIPPLRERGEDILLLARRFMESFARRIGRKLSPPDQESRDRLLAYGWPGNVRELRNVIERAVITAVDGRLDLARALPGQAAAGDTPRARAIPGGGIAGADSGTDPASQPILTVEELRELERANIVRALERSGGKVSGEGGAAVRLGMKGSTLASRILALGIDRDAAAS